MNRDPSAPRSTHHIEIDVGGELRMKVPPVEVGLRAGNVVCRAVEPEFFTRPTGENEVALELQFPRLLLIDQELRKLHHGRDARGVVVRAEVNLLCFLAPCSRSSAISIAEVIDVGPDHHRFR